MTQPQRGDGFGHAARLVPVNRSRTPLGHRAKAAMPRADIAQQHEGRGVMVPAFANIRTLRRLANRMQPKPARQFLKVMKVVAHRELSPLSHEGFGLGSLGPRSIWTSWEDADMTKLDFISSPLCANLDRDFLSRPYNLLRTRKNPRRQPARAFSHRTCHGRIAILELLFSWDFSGTWVAASTPGAHECTHGALRCFA